ncbi:MAG: hypothetical protein QNJ15_09270 [Erythrobacter sp.]|nr:hypothetical protein [Erythrobacter sp.]
MAPEEYAKSFYVSLSGTLKDMEKSLKDGETIMFSGVGPNAREAYINQVIRRGPFIQVVGTTENDELVILTFAPDQVALQWHSVRAPQKRKPIGFEQFD